MCVKIEKEWYLYVYMYTQTHMGGWMYASEHIEMYGLMVDA